MDEESLVNSDFFWPPRLLEFFPSFNIESLANKTFSFDEFFPSLDYESLVNGDFLGGSVVSFLGREGHAGTRAGASG